MDREELFALVMEQYRKHGNSMNGCQLNIMENKMNMWIQKIGINETKRLLTEDFNTFHFKTALPDTKCQIEYLDVIYSICIEKRDDEKGDDVMKHLLSMLDSELCNLADHRISYKIHKVFEHRRDDCESEAEKSVC